VVFLLKCAPVRGFVGVLILVAFGSSSERIWPSLIFFEVGSALEANLVIRGAGGGVLVESPAESLLRLAESISARASM
jgi:hypothetical protein